MAVMTKIETVLCPVDFSDLTERELDLAVGLCRRLKARLVVVYNLQAGPPEALGVSWMWSGEDASGRMAAAAAERSLKAILGRMTDQVECEARLTRGPLDATLLALARELPAQLMVMGSHGWGTTEHASLTESMIRSAPCPVLTLAATGHRSGWAEPRTASRERRRILAPLELDHHSTLVADQAMELARRLDTRLTFLHVESGGRAPLAGSGAGLRGMRDLVPKDLQDDVDLEVDRGIPADRILDAAGRLNVDLIVMGSHAHWPLRRLFGSPTSQEVLHDSHCPVWFVPPGVARGAA